MNVNELLKVKQAAFSKSFNSIRLYELKNAANGDNLARVSVDRKRMHAFLSLPGLHCVGYGTAGGYGYDVESAAIANAFKDYLNIYESSKESALAAYYILKLARDIKENFSNGMNIDSFFDKHGILKINKLF